MENGNEPVTRKELKEAIDSINETIKIQTVAIGKALKEQTDRFLVTIEPLIKDNEKFNKVLEDFKKSLNK